MEILYATADILGCLDLASADVARAIAFRVEECSSCLQAPLYEDFFH